MHKLLTVVFCFIIFAGCKKDEPGGIEIRAENFTDEEIDSVMLAYDITSFDYGKINPGETTSYHFYDSMVDNAATTFVLNNNNKILAGYILIDLPPGPPHLTNGKYTLKIFPDTTLPSGYNAKFLKE